MTIVLDVPENQPQRAAIAKLIVRKQHQGRGIGSALMNAAELAAIRAKGYALRPHGELTATIIYWKSLVALPLADPR